MYEENLVGFAITSRQRRVAQYLDLHAAGEPFVAQMALEIEGPLNYDRLRQALEAAVRRHEILRTRFVLRPGLNVPLQVILPEQAVSPELFSLSLVGDDSDYNRDGNLLGAVPADAFELEAGRLIHATLRGKPGCNHTLTLTVPAVCADAVSLKTIARDLADSYTTPDGELKPVVQYADVVEYFESILASEFGAIGRQYWHSLIVAAGEARLKSRPCVQDMTRFRPSVVRRRMPGAVLERARRTSIRTDLLLLTCWHMLVSRIGQRDKMVIGYEVNGRAAPELEDCVGLFATYIPIELESPPEKTFAQALQTTIETVQEAIEWQGAFKWPNEQGFHFAAFSYNDADWFFEAEDVIFRCTGVRLCSERYCIKLSCTKRAGDLDLEFWYDPTVYTEEEMEQRASQLLTLVESVVESPHDAIHSFNMIDENERRRLVRLLNESACPFPPTSIERSFEQQVERTADAVAIEHGGDYISYSALNDRANRLARHLSANGAGPEARVALCLKRGPEAVVAMLAALKAGAAYVPMDPAYPRERLAFILEDADVKILITNRVLVEQFSTSGVTVVCVDNDWAASSFESYAPVANPEAENAAYILFTSGSTGRPKGVVITRSGLLNYLNWAGAEYQFGEGMRTPLHSSLSFDLTVTSIWPPLLTGGCVVIIDDDAGIDGMVSEESGYNQYQIIKITPSHLRVLEALTEGRPDASLSRGLVIGGEALTWSDLEYWRRKAPATRLINEYGPTETVVGCCVFEAPNEGEFSGPVPIGRPIANTQAYVLDEWGGLAPAGMTGELHIGGAGLARGYWNQPALTAERFTPDGLSGEAGGRLYRTGDQVRWRADGELEYLGRLDGQVKVRGYRIELGEIEAALLQHEAVKQCAVCVREGDGAEKRLVAYLVASEEPADAELRRYLGSKLPEYMTPSAFVRLSQLPLTSNGKVDRKALPAPADTQDSKDGEVARTPVEEIVAGIWGDVLRVEQVARDQNFFELGGHSLLATQVVSRVREAFGVELGLRALFEHPTVAALADAIELERRRGRQVEASIVAIRREAQAKLPLSYAQQRLWFMQQLEPGTAAYNISMAIRLEGDFDVGALRSSLQDVVARHEALRTRFELQAGQPVQVIDEPTDVDLAVRDLREVAEGEREEQARLMADREAARPFDLERGPVWRAHVFQLGAQDHVLLLCIHHVACDGWSMGILVKELTTLYEEHKGGRKADLPRLSIQYADFAVWQREWLREETLEQQLDYWRRQFAGMRMLDLPADRPRSIARTHRGSSAEFKISSELAGSLRSLSRQEGVTLFMTLLAAFQVVLGRHTGQDNVVVGTDVANRNRMETEGLIGFFVNQLALRTDLSGNPSFRELLRRVRETTLGAYAHQDLPFDKVVEELQPDRSPGKTPIFQVLFVLEAARPEVQQSSDLIVKPFPLKTSTLKFDWAVIAHEMKDGIEATWRYNPDLFDPSTIQQNCLRFHTLLEKVAASPNARLGELNSKTDGSEGPADRVRRPKAFGKGRPKTVSLPLGNLVATTHLSPGQSLPLVVNPTVDDFDPIGWARTEREFIEKNLLEHGAILLRRFKIEGPADFERFVSAICPDLFTEYGDLPREQYGQKVYGSTPYPSEHPILFHNESSHMHCWPLKIWFHCLTPPQVGGQTPVVDCRIVYSEMTRALRQKFCDKGLMYVRNFSDGLDVIWQDFFKTSDPAVVEEFCRKAGILCEWRKGKGNTLRTKKRCPAVATHPKTGQQVFFNQLQAHHISCLEPTLKQSLLDLFGEEGLPRNVYYGDGESIPDSAVDELKDLYEKHASSFTWRQGDILMVDNMLVAHGRRPFVGPRKIIVAMGEMISVGALKQSAQ